ncbi:MAG TPA: RecQ family ATP-dependent DNA helicase [Actinomycetes bacterium]|nr:RecQ family ATP-dependent DNA helicase [Actinomycetes bacterium]
MASLYSRIFRRRGVHAARGEARRIARNHLGFHRLRPGQAEAVEAVVGGHDTLVVMPTGAGKSAIYQIAALLLPGPTVVVSPLIALQRDQVAAAGRHGGIPAAQANSHVGAARRREALEDFEEGDLELLFLAPEQFGDPRLVETLRAARPSLVVVDEAHCISSWGHDFRPEYLRIGGVVEALGHPRVLALTATAAPPVREEIIERLGMRDPRVLVREFDRPNLHLGVRWVSDEEAKRSAVVDWVVAAPRPGLVYTATRRSAEALAARLRAHGVAAAAYHAGMAAGERERAQQAFMEDRTEVVVATTAFGMGIDKPDVRFVAHAEVADSPDSYYQEIGRAGRDGRPAEAMLFYRPQDLGIRRFFAGGGQLDHGDLERVAAYVQLAGRPVRQEELERATELPGGRVTAALDRLQDAGAVRLLPSREVAWVDDGPGWAEAAGEASTAQAARRGADRSRVEMMRAYAETGDCRREFLLTYLGEPFEGPCGDCDNCLAGHGATQVRAAQPFPVGSRVRHPGWGAGQVLRYDEDRVTVLFDDGAYRTLGVPLVLERGLLAADRAGEAGSRPSGGSKRELYERARRLGIAGRSRMTKEELQRALREHR